MTLIINLFGAPGSGKSTTRAGVFHQLKLAGYNVEEAPEWIKGMVWEGRDQITKCQPYIFAKQLWSIERLIGKVDAIICDSPLYLSYYYGMEVNGDRYPHSFYQFVLEQFMSMNNVNFYLNRVKPYNPAGRFQTEDESDEVGRALLDLMHADFVPYIQLDGNEKAATTIADIVKARI